MYRHGVFAQAYMCTLPVTRARAWVRARTHTHVRMRSQGLRRSVLWKASQRAVSCTIFIYWHVHSRTAIHISVCVYRHVYLQGSAPRSTHMSTYSSACMSKHISRHTKAHTPTHTCLRTCLRTCLHTFSAGYLHHIHQPCSRHIAKPVATDCELSQT